MKIYIVIERLPGGNDPDCITAFLDREGAVCRSNNVGVPFFEAELVENLPSSGNARGFQTEFIRNLQNKLIEVDVALDDVKQWFK